MNINKASSWSETEIGDYLTDTVIPMRIATSAGEFPTLCSVWFIFDHLAGELICATHEDSKLAKDLLKNQNCAFEIAPNEPPYMGVRGTARATLVRSGAHETLCALMDRFLGGTESSLAKWLLSRSEAEYVVRLTPASITAWDYSERMD